jgi:hypothetical protein
MIFFRVSHDSCAMQASFNQLPFPIMLELRSLETAALVELLATQTQKYTKMLSEGCSEEDFAKCSLVIRAIQSEIELRKRTSANTSTTDSNIVFPE